MNKFNKLFYIIFFLFFNYFNNIYSLLNLFELYKPHNIIPIQESIQKVVFLKSNIIFRIDEKNSIKSINNLSNYNLINNISKKKILHISPSGLYGFYDFGICNTIKKKFNLNNYIFNGVSAGSWNSLLMVYKKNNDVLINKILKLIYSKKIKTIFELQLELKNILLNYTKQEDYELDKLFITVCVFKNNRIYNYIYTDFISLENAIDCCIASSNIPFLTGPLFYKFNNMLSYDGGFLKKPHLIIKKNPDFIINNSIFGKKVSIGSLFLKKNNFTQLYNEGLNDSFQNIYFLEKYFKKKIN